MRTIHHYGSDPLHIEIPLGIVNVKPGLRDTEGRRVTSVEIVTDQAVHHPDGGPIALDGYHNNRLVQLKLGETELPQDPQRQAERAAYDFCAEVLGRVLNVDAVTPQQVQRLLDDGLSELAKDNMVDSLEYYSEDEEDEDGDDGEDDEDEDDVDGEEDEEPCDTTKIAAPGSDAEPAPAIPPTGSRVIEVTLQRLVPELATIRVRVPAGWDEKRVTAYLPEVYEQYREHGTDDWTPDIEGGSYEGTHEIRTEDGDEEDPHGDVDVDLSGQAFAHGDAKAGEDPAAGDELDVLDQDELDERVHDAKGEEAAEINNQGREAQLRYLRTGE
jgi:hypothetical protein